MAVSVRIQDFEYLKIDNFQSTYSEQNANFNSKYSCPKIVGLFANDLSINIQIIFTTVINEYKTILYKKFYWQINLISWRKNNKLHTKTTIKLNNFF